MNFVIMGVTGCGKTTVGKLLAERLGYQFIDADDHHSEANIEKMRSGFPLNDGDRTSWLEALSTILSANQKVVLACSALKKRYRSQLRSSAEVQFVYLQADPQLVRERMETRNGHYMPTDLIESQFHDLEEPENALTLDAGLQPDQLVSKITANF